MAEQRIPSWKQVFDAADRTLGGRVNEFARGENFAILAGLVTRSRSELAERSERASRQALHLLNLPAGSDVKRLLAQIGLLEREVRDLRKQLDDQQAVAPATTLRTPKPSSITASASTTARASSNNARKAANGVARKPSVRVDQHSA
jgi:hypothetical protein